LAIFKKLPTLSFRTEYFFFQNLFLENGKKKNQKKILFTTYLTIFIFKKLIMTKLNVNKKMEREIMN